jgi:hypothetical protein
MTLASCIMPSLIYRCPVTGKLVQTWSADDGGADDETYEPFSCLACGQIHLVNRSTGHVIGQNGD